MNAPNLYHKTLNPLFKTLISCSIHTSRNSIVSNPAIEFALNEADQRQSSKPHFNSPAQNDDQFQSQEKDVKFSKLNILHPWSEWVDLMQLLLKKGYFDGTGNPFVYNGELGKKQANLVRMACLNFARDHYQLIRYFSRDDITVIAGAGCPNMDRKVVNSGKRLRAYVGIVEGNVCSSCILRGDCDRAYVKAREDEGGRTVDVMRLLLMYCLDPIVGSVENKTCLNKKVKESVRTLVKEMVAVRIEERDDEMPKASHSEWSRSTQENDSYQERNRIDVPVRKGDWICAKCDFLNFARNVKCFRCDTFSEEKLRMVAAEQDNLPLKKGDWICNKCKFLNFARNTKCYQCKEKAPTRKLNPGEWECESCNYLNFRRNMVCLKCDHRRPIASNAANNTPNYAIMPSFEKRKQNSTNHRDPIKFTEDGCPEYGSSVQNTDVMDFPILGGRSDMSRNFRNQEPRKKEMQPEYLTSDDDSGSGSDNEMADWFKGGMKTLSQLRC